MLRNRIRGYTYWSLRPEWRVLDLRIEISRTLYFYACFFGRERRDWWSLYYSAGGVWWFVVVVVVACVKSISIFLDFNIRGIS